MFGWGRDKLIRRIEELIESDLDQAAEVLTANRRRLGREAMGRLSGLIRSKLHARDQVDYLSRGLAEESISATAACQLLTSYLDAGYVDQSQFGALRRTAFEAHRSELVASLNNDHSHAGDHFRLLDSYRSAGCLSNDELAALEDLIDAKLNPAKAASRLFSEARVASDSAEREALLHRYLMEFEGFPDYGVAASEYIALKIDQLWRVLPSVRDAREAAVAINELNSLLVAYLPYTNDISLSVPIDAIFAEFLAMAPRFKAELDVEGPVTIGHLRQMVVVAEKHAAEEGTYEAERNALVEEGAEGRVVAVRPDRVVVSLLARSLEHTRVWAQAGFEGSQYSHIHPGSSLSVWAQAELGLVQNVRPSPVFVHQYRSAVYRMNRLLEQHREDRSPSRLSGGEEAVQAS